MLPKSVAEMDESDETRKNTLANLNEVAAGKPDGCKRCEIVIEDVFSKIVSNERSATAIAAGVGYLAI
jgi:hypothetical protein